MPDTLPPQPQSKQKRTPLTYNGFSGRVQDPEHQHLSTSVASPAGVGDVLRPDDLILYEQQLAERMDRGEPVSADEIDALEALRRGEPVSASKQFDTEPEVPVQPRLKLTAELNSKLTPELILNTEVIPSEAYEDYNYNYEEQDLLEPPEQQAELSADPNTLYAQVAPALSPWPAEVPWKAVRPLPAGDHYTERVLRTHRLPPDVAAALDSLDELCRSNLRLRINLSDIVAAAITLAIQDVADHGIHSPLLRTLLGPLYQQLAGAQTELKLELKSNLQSVLNAELTSQLKSELNYAPLIDSNHPSGINSHEPRRDDSSRLGSLSILKPELKSNTPHPPERVSTPRAPLTARTEDLQRWQIFITDFEREIPGNPAGNKPATAGQIEALRQKAGVSVEEFVEAFYEARARYQRADKSKLRTHWGYLISEIAKILGVWEGGMSS